MMDSFSEQYSASVRTPMLRRFCNSDSCLYSLDLLSINFAGLVPSPLVGEEVGFGERAEEIAVAASVSNSATGDC